MRTTCRSAVYGYTPSTHDYMPSITVLPCHQLSVPPKPTFLLLVMLESWHPTFARLLLHHGVSGELMWDRSTCHPHMITCSPARPSLSPTLSFMALYLRSPGCAAKSMIVLLPSVCTRIYADYRCRTPLSMLGQKYTPSTHDYMSFSSVWLHAIHT